MKTGTGIITRMVAAGLLAATGMVCRAQSVTVTPHRAFDYYNNVGVNTHLRWDTSVYYTQFDGTIYPALEQLGIKTVRDELPSADFLSAADTAIVEDRFIKLHDSLGIKMCFVLTSGKLVNADSFALRDGAGYLSMLEHSAPLRNATRYLEGYNEPDMNIYNSYPLGWDTITYAMQRGLYNRVHSGVLSPILVLSPSFIEYWSVPSRTDQVAAISPPISTYFDLANIHSYDTGPDSNDMFPGWYYDITGTRFDTIRQAKPWVITETGYETARLWNIPSSAGYAPYDNHYLSELASAKYYSVMSMEHFSRGATGVYSYELMDGNTTDSANKEMNFGLLHTDGSAKPAYTAIKNTLQLFADTDAAFTPTPLSLTLAGDTMGVKYMVYQKYNGDYLLALWQGIETGTCYSFLTFTDFPADSQLVYITFPFPFTSSDVYQPLTAAYPLYSVGSSSMLNLYVPDHLLVIALHASLSVASATAKSGAITVYPNPCRDYFTLGNLPPEAEEYSLYATDGRLLLHGFATSATATVGCDGLSPGMYLLVLKDKDGKVDLRTKVVIAP